MQGFWQKNNKKTTKKHEIKKFLLCFWQNTLASYYFNDITTTENKLINTVVYATYDLIYVYDNW